MAVRQVFCTVLVSLLLFTALAACSSPPAMRHPEMFKAAEDFRPLTTVPARPQVQVPLYSREALEQELRENNSMATRDRETAGMPDLSLPQAEPSMPPPLPAETPEEMSAE